MVARPTPVQAVIFDWGGTLTPWHTIALAEQWQRYSRALLATPGREPSDQADRLAAALLAAEDEVWRRGRQQRLSARIDEVLSAAGVAGHPHHARALAAYQQFWEPHTHTHPQVAPLFRRLRESGLKVGVLSNTLWTREYHRSIFDRDGVLGLIDGDVYTSEIPWAKPHPKSFHAAAAAVGVTVSEAVYVGDRPHEDIFGAQQAGMRAILIPHSQIPVAQQVEVSATPDAIAYELAEIAGIIAGWNASVPR